MVLFGIEREGLINNDEILRYLNRLADMLFAPARFEEQTGLVDAR